MTMEKFFLFILLSLFAITLLGKIMELFQGADKKNIEGVLMGIMNNTSEIKVKDCYLCPLRDHNDGEEWCIIDPEMDMNIPPGKLFPEKCPFGTKENQTMFLVRRNFEKQIEGEQDV